MRTRLASLALLLAGSMLVACSDDTTTEATDSGTDTSGSETGSDTGTPPDGATETSVDAPKPTVDTCKKFVETTCGAKTATCCATSGYTWKETACRTNLDTYCTSLVGDVALGRSTFDASYLDACLAGWDASLTACTIDGLTAGKNQIPCQHLFNGLKKPGAECEGKTVAECEAPDGMGAYCDIKTGETKGVCRAYAYVGKDAACNWTGTTAHYCNAGLYCDLSTTTSTCKEQKALGAACSGDMDASCGSNACKDMKCTARLPEGSACTTWNDCASFDCGTDGKCTKLYYAAVSAYQCGAM